jgi:hypothetical protein
VHSGFKLPVPILETSTSSMRQGSPEAELIKEAAIIIIDEVTMMTKHGLRCVDMLLRDIMQERLPFGGKVVVIGGDFRQTLPVVVRGTRVDVVECCIKSSPLWSVFEKLLLVDNIRSIGQNSYNKWLLDVGTGNIPVSPILPVNSIKLPAGMIVNNSLIDNIFGQSMVSCPTEQLAKSAILAPTNRDTLHMNRQILAKLPGDLRTYFSADSIDTDDPNDIQNNHQNFYMNKHHQGCHLIFWD